MDIPIEAVTMAFGVVGSVAGAAIVVGKDRQKNEQTRERVSRLEKRDETIMNLQIEIEKLKTLFTDYLNRSWPTHERRVEGIEAGLNIVIPRLASLEATLKER